MALGTHIRELRRRANLSQAAVAARVGIDVSYLSKLENDRQGASDRVLRSLAEALGVEQTELLLIAGRIPAEFQDVLRQSLGRSPKDGSTALEPPRYRTRLVARPADISCLRHLVERAGALVSVTGPPGCGKTRLVAELATERMAMGAPTNWVSVRADASEVEASLALVQNAPAGLVVIDDADMCIERCTAAALQLVGAGATVVATTRQPLRVNGEQHMRLGALPVPDRRERLSRGEGFGPDLRRLAAQESVTLFVDRAALAAPDFRLDRANAQAVFDVCQWLDGLPLAIELAALRLRQMTITDLAGRVSELLTWLTGNISDAPDRHTSMSAAIGWSFDRLDDELRRAAARLSVLESVFTLDDAFEVAGDGGSRSDSVVTTVMELLDRSLLTWHQDADGHAVYRWPLPVRQYAHRELDRTPERGRVQRAERARAEPGRGGGRQPVERVRVSRHEGGRRRLRLVDRGPD